MLKVPRRVGKRNGKALSIAPSKLEKQNTVSKRLNTKGRVVIGRTLWGLWSLLAVSVVDKSGTNAAPSVLISPTNYGTLCFAPWPVVCIKLLFLRRGWFPSFMLG